MTACPPLGGAVVVQQSSFRSFGVQGYADPCLGGVGVAPAFQGYGLGGAVVGFGGGVGVARLGFAGVGLGFGSSVVVRRGLFGRTVVRIR